MLKLIAAVKAAYSKGYKIKVQKKLPGIYMEYHESSFDHGSNGDRVFQYV